MTDRDALVEQMARELLRVEYFDCEPAAYNGSLDVFFAEIDDEHMYLARDKARAVLPIAMEAVATHLERQPSFGDGKWAARIVREFDAGRRALEERGEG